MTERFIQSALREWAYGIACNHSSERTAMLTKWPHTTTAGTVLMQASAASRQSGLKSASCNNG